MRCTRSHGAHVFHCLVYWPWPGERGRYPAYRQPNRIRSKLKFKPRFTISGFLILLAGCSIGLAQLAYRGDEEGIAYQVSVPYTDPLANYFPTPGPPKQLFREETKTFQGRKYGWPMTYIEIPNPASRYSGPARKIRWNPLLLNMAIPASISLFLLAANWYIISRTRTLATSD